MKSFVATIATLALSACASSGTSMTSPPNSSSASSAAASTNSARRTPFLARGATPITHVIIVVQENRTTDNLFQGLSGADTQNFGLDSNGNKVPLKPVSLGWNGDINHSHRNFLTECNPNPSKLAICQMNGWNHAATKSPSCVSGNNDCAYAYVPRSESQPYFDMAAQFAFGDRMFETNEGPSFVAHQELISGTASAAPAFPNRQAAENPFSGLKPRGGCDSSPDTKVETIPLEPIGAKEGDSTYPCFDRPTLGDLLTGAGVPWRYYQCGTGAGLWHAYDAIKHIRDSSNYSNLVIPEPQQILADINSNSLAGVSWVAPDGKHSDHPGVGNNQGPSWVAAIVNAVGKSSYWNSTAIIVTWDDWGGWYDHVAPQRRNNYEVSFRVPILLISPYVVEAGYVSHVPHEFGSILHFVEETFGLGSLGTTDATSDDLQDSFNYDQSPRSFSPISAPAFTPKCTAQNIDEDP